jgi:hypothetical protein
MAACLAAFTPRLHDLLAHPPEENLNILQHPRKKMSGLSGPLGQVPWVKVHHLSSFLLSWSDHGDGESPKAHHGSVGAATAVSIRAVEEVHIAVPPNGVLAYLVGARHFHRPPPSKQLALYWFALWVSADHANTSDD